MENLACRQKNDRRDAELLLESLLRGEFPAVHVPCLKGAVLESGPSFPIFFGGAMKPAKRATRVVVVTSVMLSFISFWRAAAIVLNDLGSSAYYVGGIAEQAAGRAAPWFIYEWAGRAYEVVARENQRVSIPTGQQQSETGGQSGTQPEWPSDRFKSFQNSLLQIDYPDNWQAYGQGDAASIAPRGGLVDDGKGNQALAYGVIVNIYEPHWDSYNQEQQREQRLQPRGYGQGSGTSLEDATDQLVQEFRQSNRNMRVIRYHEAIQVDGERALSTYLSNDSPIGGRETDWLITLQRPEGLLFIVFTAPDRDFQGYESTFQQMLYSVRIKR
jgi:hypothetical protein